MLCAGRNVSIVSNWPPPNPPTVRATLTNKTLARMLIVMLLSTWACANVVPQLAAESRPSRGGAPDTSPHEVRYVRAGGAELHYLDWGGQGDAARGEVIVFLHGYNSNAHVFDDFAPRFTDRFRVLALTGRGFGESGAEGDSTHYSLDGAADDLRALLNSVGAPKAVLAAHSMGGWIMSRFAIRYPERVERLVYLDAAFDVNASDSLVAQRPFGRPPLADVETREDVKQWLARYFYGAWTPALESEYRARPADEASRVNGFKPLLADLHANPREFDDVQQPALAVCAAATLESEFPWLTPDSSQFGEAQQYVEQVRRSFQVAECTAFGNRAPGRRAVVLDGHHYIFITRPEQTFQAMREFLR